MSALFGTPEADSLPVVILLHDLGGSKSDWLSATDTYVALLERGYAVLAIDMRGHGETPLPDDRQVLELIDLELSVLDVHAALVWLQSQSKIDASRIAVVGSGLGWQCGLRELGHFSRADKNQYLPLAGAVWGPLHWSR